MRIAIVDDHPLVRSGVAASLRNHGWEICAEAASVKEAIAQIAHTSPDVILIDLNLPDGSGLEVVSWARKISEKIAIVVLTMNTESTYIRAALTAGASAYISKSEPISELIAAISHAHSAPKKFLAAGLEHHLSTKDDRFSLTPRELEILHHLKDGSSTEEIAGRLFLSTATVKTHLQSLYRKLGVANRTAAIDIAGKNDLL